MKRLLKISGITLLTLLLVGITATVLLMTLVNPNQFKKQISRQAHQITGRTLTIHGDIDWSFFPALGVTLNKVDLSNKKGFGKQPFASVNKINVRVKVLPLFTGTLETNKLVVDGLRLNLETKSASNNNWQNLIKKPPTPQANGKSQKDKTHSKNEFILPHSIHSPAIIINNAQINWRNLTTKQSLSLDNLQFKASNIRFDTAFPATLSFLIKGEEPSLNGQIKITSQMTFSPMNLMRKKKSQTAPFKMEGKISSKQLTINKLVLDNVNAEFNFQKNILNINPVSAKLYGGDYAGHWVINFVGTQPKYHMDEKLTNIQAAPLFRDLGNSIQLNLSGTFNATAKINSQGNDMPSIRRNLNGNVDFNLQNGTIKGINLPYLFSLGQALFLKAAVPKTPGANGTAFSKAQGTIQINNGIAKNNNLIMTANGLNITGNGTANLINESLNYHMKISNTAKKANGNGNESFAIPIIIRGPFNKLSIEPNAAEILKARLLIKGKDLKNKLDDIFKNGIGKRFKKAIDINSILGK